MKDNAGFTIMELMIVIAIIGILAGISIPNIVSWRDNHQLNSMAREVQSIIQGARQSAIKENSTVTITFDSGAKRIISSHSNRSTGTVKVVTTNLRPGIILSANFGGNSVLSYNNRGLPSSGIGSVIFTNQKGDSRSIIVNITGNSRIQ